MNDQNIKQNVNNVEISKGSFIAKMCSLFIFTYLGALIYGIVSHRDTIHLKASEMIALYIAAPTALLMLWTLLKSRRAGKEGVIALKAIFGVLCGIAGVAASIAVLVMDWKSSKAVAAYITIAVAFVIVWLVMRNNTKNKIVKILKSLLKAPIRIFVVKTEEGAPAFGSYSDFIFMKWFVLAGFVLGPIADAGWWSPKTCALIYILVGVFTVGALNNTMGKFITISIGVLLIIAYPINYFFVATQNIDALGWLKDYYTSMNITYDGDFRVFAFLWSEFWLCIIICSVIGTRLDRTHWAQAETIRRFRIIGGTETAVSNTKNADSKYPNLLKSIPPFFIGDVVVNNPDNKIEWYRVRNVWFLPFRINKIRSALRASDVNIVGQKQEENN